MNRAKVMESRMFTLLVGAKVRDELTDELIAMFLYYTHNRKEPDFAEGGRVMHEAIAPLANKIIDEIIDLEKNRAAVGMTDQQHAEMLKQLARYES